MTRRGWRILLVAVVIPTALFWGAFVSKLRQSKPRHPIPDGVYQAASGEELVAIEGRKIRFVVQGRGPAPTDVVMKEYDYTVWPNGTIEAYPMTSAEALGGPVGGCAWSWDGTVIRRRELEDAGRAMSAEPTTVFIRRDGSSRQP